jgi:hypothetical protein
MVHGPFAGIAAPERIWLTVGVESYYLFHVTLGEQFRRAGDDVQAACSSTGQLLSAALCRRASLI